MKSLAASQLTSILSFYILPALVAVVVYMRRHRAREQAHSSTLQENLEAGLTEPMSLHPVVNLNRCVGCGSCVAACPEGEILGLINGQAKLVNPTHCIGHGACAEACPVDAITLAIGSERRGVDIPVLSPDFQTTVPGIFIAGELGGMGLIRNALEQGRQALEAVRTLDGIGRGDRLDVVIVGAGPAGFAASLAAMHHGLRFVTVDQDSFGGAIVHHPRGKILVTEPVTLPLVGRVKIRETSKEALLAYWEEIRTKTGLQVREKERVEEIRRLADGFEVKTSLDTLSTRAVVLALGRRGTPRKLDVPGEETSKVVYKLSDPAQYRGKRVLVVGGGDSALEAVLMLADEDGTDVALSYRGEVFNRTRRSNRERVESSHRDGRINLLLKSQVVSIGPESVRLATETREEEIENDAVLVCAGGVLPFDFLREAGVVTETRHGTPLFRCAS